MLKINKYICQVHSNTVFKSHEPGKCVGTSLCEGHYINNKQIYYIYHIQITIINYLLIIYYIKQIKNYSNALTNYIYINMNMNNYLLNVLTINK